MIRFVDVRYQGLGARFSFWTTVASRYLSYSNNQAWSTWDEFESDYWGSLQPSHDAPGIVRFRNLCPPWAFEPATDEELEFRDDD